MQRVGALALLVIGLLGAAVDAAPRWGWLGVRIRDLSDQEVEEISKRFGLREGFLFSQLPAALSESIRSNSKS